MMTPSTTDAGDTEAGSGLTALISRVSPIPATMPNAAPTVARAADSARNWRSTSRRRAPSDFRRPISRVRSATDISMMFMITMPPITSDTITTPGRTTTRMRLIPAQNRCTPSDVSSTKLLSWLGRRWRRLRMTPSATSMASRKIGEHTSELQSQFHLVCRLLLEKKKVPPETELSRQMTTSTTSIDIMCLPAAYATLHTAQERDYFMHRYHDVISSLVVKTSSDSA